MRKTFSITDKEVLQKLEEVESQSQYIQGLVIRDIYSDGMENDYAAGMLATIDMLEKCLTNIKDSIKASTE